MCIDQNNDVEKGHQVRKMGEIYRQAKETIIWLGDDPEVDVMVQTVGVCIDWKHAEASDVQSLALLCLHEYWNRTWWAGTPMSRWRKSNGLTRYWSPTGLPRKFSCQGPLES